MTTAFAKVVKVVNESRLGGVWVGEYLRLRGSLGVVFLLGDDWVSRCLAICVLGVQRWLQESCIAFSWGPIFALCRPVHHRRCQLLVVQIAISRQVESAAGPVSMRPPLPAPAGFAPCGCGLCCRIYTPHRMNLLVP